MASGEKAMERMMNVLIYLIMRRSLHMIMQIEANEAEHGDIMYSLSARISKMDQDVKNRRKERKKEEKTL